MTINFKPTGPWNFIKPPQIVEEIDGETPAAPVWTLLGNITGISPAIGTQKKIVRNVGKRDPTTQQKLMNVYTGAVKFEPFDAKMIKRSINLPDDVSPSGNNSSSFTMAWSQLIDGVEKYFGFQGIKIDKSSTEISKDGGVTCGIDVKWTNTVAYATDLTALGITTPNYLTINDIPNTPPWSSLTSGNDPFTIEGVVIPTNRFKIDVNHNLYPLSPNGTPDTEFLGPSIREISIDFDTWVHNRTMYDYVMNLPLVDGSYIIKADQTSPVVISLNDIGFDSRNMDFDSSAKTAQTEGMQATVNSATVTDT